MAVWPRFAILVDFGLALVVPAATEKHILLEVLLACLAVAVGLLFTDVAANAWPAFSPHAGAIVAALFVFGPLALAKFRGIPGDVLGVEGGTLRGGLALGLAASLLILPVFALGFDLLQTQVFHQTRGGIGLRSAGLAYQGQPPPLRNRVAIREDSRGLLLQNRTNLALIVRPTCAHCADIALQPGQRILVTPPQTTEFSILDRGKPIDQTLLAAGSAAEPLSQPIHAEPSLTWLLWLLLTQLVAVALPEEVFFRGYVLLRLRTLWPPRRQLFGVPYGAAHVLTAILFAFVHLATIPSPHRLLVFFPALLFAWLAQRSGSVIPAVVHHALANVTLQVVARFYM